MNREDVLNTLNKYHFPREEFIVLSGAALVLFGVKLETGDIDITVTKKLYKEILKAYKCEFEKINPFGNEVYFLDSVINFSNSYIEAENVYMEGDRVQTPESVKTLKLTLNRDKDKSDIEAIEKWERRRG